MKEIKNPKRPIIFYYLIMMLIIFFLNSVVFPAINAMSIQKVDYGQFMSMMDEQNIGEVKIEKNRIIFTDKKEENLYMTGPMNDPGLVERLYESGAKFTADIVKEP